MTLIFRCIRQFYQAFYTANYYLHNLSNIFILFHVFKMLSRNIILYIKLTQILEFNFFFRVNLTVKPQSTSASAYG